MRAVLRARLQCIICMYYMYVLYVCVTCICGGLVGVRRFSWCVLCVCIMCVRAVLRARLLCSICMYVYVYTEVYIFVYSMYIVRFK